MPCYHPLSGFRSTSVNPSGKRSIVFNRNQGFADQPVELPCGQCIGCRLERSRQWAIRCVHEASLYDQNCFITLTYSPENLPKDNSLNVKHYQDFMKRLRFKFKHKKIRFFHCGEYGEKFQRPHYHSCLFNHDFTDKEHYKTINENKLYTSKILQELWPFGFSTVGALTFETAAYTARYITKKINGEGALHHYNKIDLDTGEILEERRPEYITMSRRPGIGKDWYNKYKSDVYPDDFLVLTRGGHKLKPPKFYNAQYELEHSLEYKRLKDLRIQKAKKQAHNNTYDRLRVREFIHQEKAKQLTRKFENDL